MKSIPEIMAAAYGSHPHDTLDDLGDVLNELRAILWRLDGVTVKRGEEELMKRCRDRLRKVVGE